MVLRTGDADDVTPPTDAEMPGRATLRPDTLKVRGRGLSPLRESNDQGSVDVTSPARSSRTSLSDEEMASEQSEEYSVLDGVREMNQILVRQIETLRLKIKVDEDNYTASRNNLAEKKDDEIRQKEGVISDLKDSLTHREETIQTLSKASDEKDRTIQNKCVEIEDMKKVIEQTKKYASRLHKQWSRVKHQKEGLESDTLYREQNKEIARLTEELEVLRSRLATMEVELQRATEVIELQNQKMKSMDAERATVQTKFREELDKASRAMRQEVERMREVMHQNCEEMRSLREQNQEMHEDVRAIKELLWSARGQHATHNESVTGLQFPVPPGPGQPSYARHTHGQATALSPKGPGMMVGNRLAGHKVAHPPTTSLPVRETSQYPVRNVKSRGDGFRHVVCASCQSESVTTDNTSPSARGSPDLSARTISPAKLSRAANTNRAQSISSQISLDLTNSKTRATTPKNLPPVCSIKEGVTPLVRQPSGRGGKGIVRKGSAVRK